LKKTTALILAGLIFLFPATALAAQAREGGALVRPSAQFNSGRATTVTGVVRNFNRRPAVLPRQNPQVINRTDRLSLREQNREFVRANYGECMLHGTRVRR